jgi:hypothetical protein
MKCKTSRRHVNSIFNWQRGVNECQASVTTASPIALMHRRHQHNAVPTTGHRGIDKWNALWVENIHLVDMYGTIAKGSRPSVFTSWYLRQS